MLPGKKTKDGIFFWSHQKKLHESLKPLLLEVLAVILIFQPVNILTGILILDAPKGVGFDSGYS